MKTLTYRTIIQKDDKGYHAFVPALPGCHVYEFTLEKVRKVLPEVIKNFLEVMAEEGILVPIDNSLETIETIEIPQNLSTTTHYSYV